MQSIKYIFLLINLFTLQLATIRTTYLNDAYEIINLKFTNDSYNGYISENVAQQHTKHVTEANQRRNRNIGHSSFSSTSSSTKNTSAIYIRFVDRLKPALTFSLVLSNSSINDNYCTLINPYKDNINIELNSDYDLESINQLFELDHSSYLCFRINQQHQQQHDCVCYLKIRLVDEQARDRLNREAKDFYSFQLRARTTTPLSSSSSAFVNINILDDNDLEPMFDPNEYKIELYQFAFDEADEGVWSENYLPAFSVVGRVLASDPDLSKNSLVRFYLNCKSYSHQSCHNYFGINWLTGDIYLKQTLKHLFTQFPLNQSELELDFEVKAIDYGVKLALANSLLATSHYTSLNFNQSDELIKDENEDTINFKFVSLAIESSLPVSNRNRNNRNNNIRLIKNQHYLPASTSLEAAQVKVQLIRNDELVTRNSINKIKLIKDLKSIDKYLRQQLGFVLTNTDIIPFALFQTTNKHLKLNHLKIHCLNQTNITFKLKKLYFNEPNSSLNMSMYLIYFHLTGNETFTPNDDHLVYAISNCAFKKNQCSNKNILKTFKFNLNNDVGKIFSKLCSIQLLAPNTTLKIKRDYSSQKVLFGIKHRFMSLFNTIQTDESNNDFCTIYLTKKRMINDDLFAVDYNLIDNDKTSFITLNKTNGIVKFNSKDLDESAKKFSIKLQASLYFKTILLNQSAFISVDIDLIDQFSFDVKQRNDLVKISLDLDGQHALTKIYNLTTSKTYKLIYCRMISNKQPNTEITTDCAFTLSNTDKSLYYNKNIQIEFDKANLLVRVEQNNQAYSYIHFSIKKKEKPTLEGSCFVHLKLINNETKETQLSKSPFSLLSNFLTTPVRLVKILSTSVVDKKNVAEVKLSVVNETSDSNCFEFNLNDGHIYSKCKLPITVLNQLNHFSFHSTKSKLIGLGQTIRRVLNVKLKENDNSEISFYLNISFEIGDVIKNLNNVELNLIQSNCSIHEIANAKPINSATKIDQRIRELILNDTNKRIEKEIESLRLDQSNNLIKLRRISNNETLTHLEITYTLESDSLKADTFIWKINTNLIIKSDSLYIFELIENSNDLFKLDRFDGCIRMAIDWQLPWLQLINKPNSHFKNSIKISLNSLEDFLARKNLETHVLLVDVYFNTDIKYLISMNKNELPKPMMFIYDYDIILEKSKIAAVNNDLLLIENINSYLDSILADANQLYNISYSIKQYDSITYNDLPFYVVAKGQLFYFNTQNSVYNQYDLFMFQIQVSFKYIFNEKTIFNLNVNVRVNLVNDISELNQSDSSNVIRQYISDGSAEINDPVYSIDLSVPITSADMLSFLNCPLIGLFNLKDLEIINNEDYSLKLVLPKYNSPVKKQEYTIKLAESPKTIKNRIKHKLHNQSVEVKHKSKNLSINRKNAKSIHRNKTKSVLNRRIRSLVSTDLVRDIKFEDIYFNESIAQLEKAYNKKSRTWNHHFELSEIELLDENFYSSLYLDSKSGALYFNPEKVNTKISNEQQNLYTKFAKLINHFYYERNISSKMVRVDAIVSTKSSYKQNQTISIWINLIFKQPQQEISLNPKELSNLSEQNNKFLINSNNLLNLFYNGDEFVVNVDVEENSPTWVSGVLNNDNNRNHHSFADGKSTNNSNEGPIINIKRYFESKLDYKRKLTYFNLLKNLRYYLVDSSAKIHDESYFELEDATNGILITKPSVQFDFEVNKSYFIKIMVVQTLGDFEKDKELHDEQQNEENKILEKNNTPQEDLVFPSKDEANIINYNHNQRFVYWLDLHVNVLNLVDEPFVCQEPVYHVNVDENEVKNKKIIKVDIHDYDQERSEIPKRYKAQIISGNAQGLFSMNDLTLFTGSSSRKLDRETRSQHELDIKISENNSSRFALCKIIVNVNDINDNRPVVNDIELIIYNKLDSRLVEEMKIPIANAIAIDQDHIAKLTYSIISIKILTARQDQELRARRKKLRRQKRGNEYDDFINNNFDFATTTPISHVLNETELNNLFYLNGTNGNLYSTKTEMPCYECTIMIQYRSNDVGRFKTRVSRKSSIKFYIKKVPLSLFSISNEIEDFTTSSDIGSNGQTTSTKTFDLVLTNLSNIITSSTTQHTSNNLVVLSVNEDTKLGEKIYQIKAKSKLINKEQLEEEDNTNTASSSAAIIYFTLLDDGNMNQTFYLSNHDGSLYLIKPLDYEDGKNFFNLTILVTNWIGQIEYVYMEIYIKDVNDNRPKFHSNINFLNETIDVNINEIKYEHSEKIFDLMMAQDLDDLDRNKLNFKIEDCFYLSTNLLIKKPYIPTIGTNPTTNHLNYPLCSKQFMDLVWSESKENSQLVRLKLNINELSNFLINSTDISLIKKNLLSSINFILDISVKDSLQSTSIARVDLILNLNRNKNLIFKRDVTNEIPEKKITADDNIFSNDFGFKKSKYFVIINKIEQLQKGAKLISLANEFVKINQANLFSSSFQPFALSFYVKSLTNKNGIAIEPNFGLIYLNKTLLDHEMSSFLILDDLIFEIEIGCHVKGLSSTVSNKNFKSYLFKTTKVVFSISKSVIVNQIHHDEIINRPIWMSLINKDYYMGYLFENVPKDSMVRMDKNNTELITVAKLLDIRTVEEIKNLTLFKNNPLIFNYQLLDTSQFEIDANTGYIRIGFEPDYELRKYYDVKVKACLTNTDSLFGYKVNMICFKQILSFRVFILNKNDNEPKLIMPLNEVQNYDLHLFNTSQFIRSMSLFKFDAYDDDLDLNLLSSSLIQVKSKAIGNCETQLEDLNLDSFELFELESRSDNYHKLCIKLTDTGYDRLAKLTKKSLNHNCHYKIDLICEVNDGLFSNRIMFHLNLILDHSSSSLLSIKDNSMAPIFHTMELNENSNQSAITLAINIKELLINYLNANLNSKDDDKYLSFDSENDKEDLIDMQLQNYQNLFWLNETSHVLSLKTSKNASISEFDREKRDNYEIFVGIKLKEDDNNLLDANDSFNQFINKHKYLIPSRVRIVLLISDLNDNRPQFIFPYEVRYTKSSNEYQDLFYYNRTYQWFDLETSNKTNPLLKVRATDDDYDRNGLVNYFISGSLVDNLFDVNKTTGQVYLNEQFNKNLFKLIWNKHANLSQGYLILTLNVTAKDNGHPYSLESTLCIRLHLILPIIHFQQQGDVYFQQTFYYFQISESIELNKIFANINSVKFFTHSNQSKNSYIIFSILDGDEFGEFSINYQTGELSAKTKLDYETKSTYYLTIKAFNSLNLNKNQYTNATIKIDLIDENDMEPQFDKYEYKININENLELMSELIKLTAVDMDAYNTPHSQIRYKLLSNHDNFYVNELTGIVYNKISFDYETMKSSDSTFRKEKFDVANIEDTSLFHSNMVQLKIMAYDLGSQFNQSSRTHVSKSLSTQCILTITVQDVNDNGPQFEKPVYFSQIELDDEDFMNSEPNNDLNLINTLLNESNFSSHNNKLQFVTKVNAKDVDSFRFQIVYSIIKQTQITNEPISNQNKPVISENLFSIDNQTGVVFLDLEKYKLFKQFNLISNKDSVAFNLQLLVSDHLFTSSARLNVLIKQSNIQNVRPKFVKNFVRYHLDYHSLAKSPNNSLLNITQYIVNDNMKDFHVSINLESKSNTLELFSINQTNTLLSLNLKSLNESISKLQAKAKNSLNHFILYQVPIIVCNVKQTALCDQMLILVNLTNFIETKASNNSFSQANIQVDSFLANKIDNIGFSYDYWSVTVQQQIKNNHKEEDEDLEEDQGDGMSINEDENEEEDDYYADENYESDERFYFELKTLDLSLESSTITYLNYDASSNSAETKEKKFKYEFEIANCSYSSFSSIQFNNVSIQKQIKNFIQSIQSTNNILTLQQLKSIFSINKHNGVLSSRKVINQMLPGIYTFNIRLKLITANASSYIDSMQFKLLIVPPNNWLKHNSKQLFNYFKFDKEFYKFKFNASGSNNGDLGRISLINRYQNLKPNSKIFQNNAIPKQSNETFENNISYKLVLNKFSRSFLSANELFDLNEASGALSINLMKSRGLKFDMVKKALNEDYELVLYVLARVRVKPGNDLEYMGEIHVNFKSLIFDSINQEKIEEFSLKNVLRDEDDDNSAMVKFGKVMQRLKLNENYFVSKGVSVIYKFIAIINFNSFNNDISKSFNSIEYSISDSSQNPYLMKTFFEINSKNGELRLLQKLNKKLAIAKFESGNINLNISACFSKHCSWTIFSIDLIDTNDNAPVFERKIYEGVIREDSLPGTVISTLFANDIDFSSKEDGQNEELYASAGFKSSKLEYFILNGDKYNQFAISPDGKVYTRLMIDRESVRNYSLDIMAFDGKFKSLAKLNIQVLNVNDNRPDCVNTLVVLNVSESLPIGSVIYNINALDLDNENNLKYEFIGTNDNEQQLIVPFGINERTGSLKVTEQLDYEFRKSYVFYIRVLNNDVEAAGDINLENKKIYSSNKFLPWSSYCLVKLKVNLIDENDNKPEFTKTNYIASIYENSPYGTLLMNYSKLISLDLDSKLNGLTNFSIIDDSQLFRIVDQRSGCILLNTNNLDREKYGDWINLTIRAADYYGLYSDSILAINIIDLNDNKPKFDSNDYYLSIEENLPLGFTIAKVNAIDLDLNSTVEYYLLNETATNDSAKFLVNKKTGEIILNDKLDYEHKSQYVIHVVAIDPYLNNTSQEDSVAKIVIDLLDVNDNAPKFATTTLTNISINENLPVNSTICNLTAIDTDKSHKNNRLAYLIKSGNEMNLFGIDSKTGRLYTNKKFDYEQLSQFSYLLTIECSDNGEAIKLTDTIKLNISIEDVNDNQPIFQRQNQTLVFKENYPLGQEITKFQISDPDRNNHGGAPFTFTIMEQYKSSHLLTEPMFSIDPNGSLILVQKPMSNQTYLLKVRCYDSGIPPLFSDTFLTIKVTDEASHEPKMTDGFIEIITVGFGNELDSESSISVKPNQIIGELKATDVDKQDNLFYDLSPSTNGNLNDLDYLEINKQTGLLMSKKEFISSNNLSLVSTVTDKKFITESKLNINILNVNKECMSNSLFIKFNIWYDNTDSPSQTSDFNSEHFIKFGYLKRFKESVIRLFSNQANALNAKNSNKSNQTIKYDLFIIGLRETQLNSKNQQKDIGDFDFLTSGSSSSNEEISFDHEMHSGSIIELIFSVTKQTNVKNCLNAKYVSKVLNKRKSVLLKRIRQVPANIRDEFDNQAYKIKIVDMSYNHECNSKKKSFHQTSICTTNVALQNCKLKFLGYNQPNNLCVTNDNETSCLLLPKHEWICESALTRSDSKNEDIIDESSSEYSFYETTTKKTTTTSLATKKSLSDQQLQNYGKSCKKPYNPCKNNAICKQVKVASLQSSTLSSSKNKPLNSSIKIRIHCFCPSGFKGRFCEEDIDECSEHELLQKKVAEDLLTSSSLDANVLMGPCSLNSKCVNTYGSFICNCSSASASSCYNLLSPQYSASTADSLSATNSKYSSYRYSVKNGNNFVDPSVYDLNNDEIEIEGSFEEENTNNDNEETKDQTMIKTFFGPISNATVKHALIGLFAGICVVLIILSLVAGIVCKINMKHHKYKSKSNPRDHHYGSYRMNNSLHHHHLDTTTCCESNADCNDVMMYTSSTSSPKISTTSGESHSENLNVIAAQKKLNIKKKKHQSAGFNRFNRNKHRSTIKTSLLSAANTNCNNENDHENIHDNTFENKSTARPFSLKRFLFKSKSSNQASKKETIKLMDNIDSSNLIKTIVERKELVIASSQETSSLEPTSSSSASASSSTSSNSPKTPIVSHTAAIYETNTFRKKLSSTNELSENNNGGLIKIATNNNDHLATFNQKNKFNTLSSFSSSKMNYETLSEIKKPTTRILTEGPTFKYNTTTKAISCKYQANKNDIREESFQFSGSTFQNNITNQSHLTTTIPAADVVQEKEDSINMAEDCSQQGFYWDITDWAGGIASIDPTSLQQIDEAKNPSQQSIMDAKLIIPEIIIEDLSCTIGSSTCEFSPIYSTNFKPPKVNDTISHHSSNDSDEDTYRNDEETNNMNNSNNNQSVLATLLNSKTYMYLTNADECNQTFDSHQSSTNQEDVVTQITNASIENHRNKVKEDHNDKLLDDENEQEEHNHYFMPKF